MASVSDSAARSDAMRSSHACAVRWPDRAPSGRPPLGYPSPERLHAVGCRSTSVTDPPSGLPGYALRVVRERGGNAGMTRGQTQLGSAAQAEGSTVQRSTRFEHLRGGGRVVHGDVPSASTSTGRRWLRTRATRPRRSDTPSNSISPRGGEFVLVASALSGRHRRNARGKVLPYADALTGQV
jgi:hypothetical protein